MADKPTLQKAEACFEAGDFAGARTILKTLLADDPNQAELLNALGAVEAQAGNLEAAVAWLERSFKLDPTDRDAGLNLAAVLRELGRPGAVLDVLDSLATVHSDDPDLIAMRDVCARETDVSSNVSHLAARPKMALLCIRGMENFIGDIAEHFGQYYECRQVVSLNQRDFAEAAAWADIVWIEWANQLAIDLTKHPTLLDGKTVVCRLHSYEAYAGFVPQIDWSKIDTLIVVAAHIREHVMAQVPDIMKKVNEITVIPSGIDLDRFPFRKRSAGPHVAYLGSINYKKGPMLLFHAFHALTSAHPEFRLSIGGDIQDARYHYYFEQLSHETGIADRIHFDGHIADVPGWLEDKDLIVCSSVLESQYLAIMEAMACGIKPAIHNFVGASGIYPREYLWNTIPEFVGMATNQEYKSLEYREFIQNNYEMKKQLEALSTLVERRLGIGR